MKDAAPANHSWPAAGTGAPSTCANDRGPSAGAKRSTAMPVLCAYAAGIAAKPIAAMTMGRKRARGTRLLLAGLGGGLAGLTQRREKLSSGHGRATGFLALAIATRVLVVANAPARGNCGVGSHLCLRISREANRMQQSPQTARPCQGGCVRRGARTGKPSRCLTGVAGRLWALFPSSLPARGLLPAASERGWALMR